MVPKLRINKSTSRYFVVIGANRKYLGKWNGEKRPPKEIVQAYRNALRLIVAPQHQPSIAPRVISSDPTVVESVAAYLTHHEKNMGRFAMETAEIALRPVVALYRREPAKSIGPLRLQEVRDHLVKKGRTRTGVNNQINRIKRAWKWFVSMEMVPPSLMEGHRAVGALRMGHTTAPESKGKPQVRVEDAENIALLANPTIAAMIRLQVLTGLRPAEVCAMTLEQIDQSDPECWFYRPLKYKTAWMGKRRAIPLGPRCQEIIRPFLKPEQPQDAVFSPIDAMEAHQDQRRIDAKQPSRYDRKVDDPKWQPGQFYCVASYRRAIARICDKNGLPRWAPSCLRATRAQTVFEVLGLDAAKHLLGHSDSLVTQRHYLHQAEGLAKQLALKFEQGPAE